MLASFTKRIIEVTHKQSNMVKTLSAIDEKVVFKAAWTLCLPEVAGIFPRKIRGISDHSIVDWCKATDEATISHAVG